MVLVDKEIAGAVNPLLLQPVEIVGAEAGDLRRENIYRAPG